ncbi:hypothetical protein HOF92_06970 [bacterium]|jgi:hypothetical protein|nr:hypothetical protein [bacterium]
MKTALSTSLFFLFCCVCSSRSYYFGQGVGFEIPDRWIPIEEDSEESKLILKSFSVSLSEKTLEQLRVNRCVVFLIPKNKEYARVPVHDQTNFIAEGPRNREIPALAGNPGKPNALGNIPSTSAFLLHMDIIPTSSTYSRVLQQYFEEFVSQGLEKKGFLVLPEIETSSRPVEGIPSPFLKIPSEKGGANFLSVASLVPCYDFFLYFNGLLPVEEESLFLEEFNKVLNSFSGSGKVHADLGLWKFFLQAFLIAFLILYFKNRSENSS